MKQKVNKRDLLVGLLAVIIVLVVSILFLSMLFANSGKTTSVQLNQSTAPPMETKNSSITILFVGDIMLDRHVKQLIDTKGFDYIFAGVSDLIKSADIAIGNLEGPFTDNHSVVKNNGSQLTFTFDPAIAPKLAALGFDVLGLANNHTENFGRSGFLNTQNVVKAAGMQYFGDPENMLAISTTTNLNGISVGFVGFNEFSYKNFDNVIAEIDRLRPLVDVVVVVAHWGIEYQAKPTEFMSNWAHEFIDHGADAVVGGHPHVIGTAEIYKGKPIFYSLGNFMFDQYFSPDVQLGLAVKMKVDKTMSTIGSGTIFISYSFIPIRIDQTGAHIATSTKALDAVTGVENELGQMVSGQMVDLTRY
ncbi:MAG: CapA family protein [Patescibacteria group bacterium]|nr:CapA family protein [Patescibacteria group bacterium]